MLKNLTNITQHPLRKNTYSEIHSRPYPNIEQSAKVTHFAVLTSPDQAKDQLEKLQSFAEQHDASNTKILSNCYYTNLNGFELRWEKHQEFCSITFIEATQSTVPFAKESVSIEISNIINSLAGELVVALKVHFERNNQQASIEDIKTYFENQQLYGSTIVDDKASMWSSFKLHSDDYARMLIYDKNLSNYQAGRTLQRVIEVAPM